MERPVNSTRVSHKTQHSQDDFAKRLKHLQRSDPVDPQELTRRLNAVIAEARNHGRRYGERSSLANARDVDGQRSRSRTPSEASSPRQHVRQSTRDPLNVARSTLIFDARQDDDDPMSRVVNALKVLKDIDQSGPPSIVASPTEVESNHRAEYPWSQHPDGRSEINRAVARKPEAFVTPKIIEVAKSKTPSSQPQTTHPASTTADTFQKRASRRAPAPLIVAVMPKAVRGSMVDVSSPMTTKPVTNLPDLEPLSPFGATFSKNGRPFLVHQRNEVRHSHLFSEPALELSLDPDAATSSTKNSSAMAAVICRSDSPSAKASVDHFALHGDDGQLEAKRQAREEHTQYQAQKAEDKRREAGGQGNGQHRRSMHSARLSQLSESDSTDGQSDQGMSPVFETSAGQSSRTSLGQNSNPNLNGISLKRTGFTPEEVQDRSSIPASFENTPRATAGSEMFSPVFPRQLATDTHPPLQQNELFRSRDAQQATSLPNRNPSTPQAHDGSASSKRHSIPRKPLALSIDENDLKDDQVRQVVPERPARHDSTGFTVAREFLRDSIDSGHVRHVHTAARRTSQNESDLALNAQHLPKLTTSMSRPGKMEEIADGIVLINSDSPVITKQMINLPALGNMRFRQPSYTKEVSVSPDGNRRGPNAGSPRFNQLSSSIDISQRFLDLEEHPNTAIKRQPSRERRGTDGTIKSVSSRPDFRARPLMTDPAGLPFSPNPLIRPRTAGARPSQTAPIPPPLVKLPSKITFPPRANMAELGAMSPESLTLLHQQEALLRKRYDTVLNPIDDALMKRPSTVSDTGAHLNPMNSSKIYNHSRSGSTDLRASMSAAASTTDLDLIRHEDDVAQQQAAIRMQRRNLGAAVRQPSRHGEGNGRVYEEPPTMLDHQFGYYGGGPGAFPSPVGNTKSSFPFDDVAHARKKRPSWKFWKKR